MHSRDTFSLLYSLPNFISPLFASFSSSIAQVRLSTFLNRGHPSSLVRFQCWHSHTTNIWQWTELHYASPGKSELRCALFRTHFSLTPRYHDRSRDSTKSLACRLPSALAYLWLNMPTMSQTHHSPTITLAAGLYDLSTTAEPRGFTYIKVLWLTSTSWKDSSWIWVTNPILVVCRSEY